MKNLTTFTYYKSVKKSAVKTLINAGIEARIAFNMLRDSMPYLFNSKSECDAYDFQYGQDFGVPKF